MEGEVLVVSGPTQVTSFLDTIAEVNTGIMHIAGSCKAVSVIIP